MKTTIDSTRAALASLDFTAENQAAAEILAELDRIREASQRASDRLGEIGLLLNSPAPEEQIGRDVANALLDGTDPAEAAQDANTRDSLHGERASLSAALVDLRKRENGLSADLAELHNRARGRLADPMRPVIAEIERNAQAAAELIGDAYAMLAAIAAATKQGAAEADKIGQAFARLIGAGLIRHRVRVDVAPEVRAMLAPLAKAGIALQVGVPEWAAVPEDMRNTALLAAVEARRAVG